jgi:hypothetical protein
LVPRSSLVPKPVKRVRWMALMVGVAEFSPA